MTLKERYWGRYQLDDHPLSCHICGDLVTVENCMAIAFGWHGETIVCCEKPDDLKRFKIFVREKKLNWVSFDGDSILYAAGLEALRGHVEEVIVRVMKGRAEGKGNFAYLEDPDMKRERRLAKWLQFFLSRENLRLQNDEDREGLCDQKCIDCHHRRYNFHSKKEPEHWNNDHEEGWYCQKECECK